MPNDFLPSSQIHILQDGSKEDKKKKDIIKFEKEPYQKQKPKRTAKDKAFTYDEVRQKQKNAYNPWTPELDDELTIMYCEGVNVKDIAKHFGRTKGAIRSRIKKLELEELYG